jgi:NAD(P)-dependent dehydrogenase (short-subunit alcohol dehydrogenase family)
MGIDLNGKVAIVTGGARGIGNGMATALAKAGAAVTITDILEDTLDEASARLREIPGARHLAIVANGCRDDDVSRAVQRTVDEFGRIDVLINNAQTSIKGKSILEHTIEDVMVAIDSNVLASIRYMKAAFPYLRDAQGTVINFASQAGLMGNENMLGYNTAKEANRALTRTGAREWAQYNITVNCIIPGMKTEGITKFFADYPDHAKHSLANIPLGRLGDPEKDAGALAVFLASDGGHYITGETISIDGGRYMRP